MAGFTFSQARIGQILQEIERRKVAAKDFIGSTKNVRAVVADGQFTLKFDGHDDLYGFTRNGRVQLADVLGIPTKFFDRLADEKPHQQQLAALVNHLFSTPEAGRMFRTLDGKVRATLSPRYRSLCDSDLFYAAADEFQKAGAEIWEARLTDDTFRLYAVAQGISGEVREEVVDGTHWKPSDGGSAEQRAGLVDRHVAAVALDNSETGRSRLRVRPCTLNMVCANWNVWHTELAVMHVGKKQEEAGWISEDTERLEDRLTWAKVRDVIKTAFDPARFAEVIAAMNKARAEKVLDPIKAVSGAVAFTGLPEGSVDAIRSKFILSKDYTKYGLAQAVNWQTHDAASDEAKDAYDDAGGKLLGASMNAIMAAAPKK